ncbi:MAG: NAD(P)-dependent oxidoreductase [Verrucomicrobiota bacterium]|jgi:nucleoside-diphosphate-sugar epimerase
MRYFITGATGFVGSHLTHKLLASGAQVAILVRNPEGARRIRDLLDRVTVIRGELSSIRACADALKSFRPDVVFHLGWSGANSYQHQQNIDQVYLNVDGSLKLVRLTAEAGCKKFIGMGSVIEYGRFDRELHEDLPVKPDNLYGASKFGVGLLSEFLCKSLGMTFAWFRLSWGYGPDDDAARMIPYVIQSLLQRKKPSLTPGKQLWDYLYIDDIVDALRLVANLQRVGGTFNLGCGEPRRIREIVEFVRDQIDPSLQIGFGDIPYREGQAMSLQVNNRRLRDATGWSPKVPLEVGLRKTVQWYAARRKA